MIKYSNDTLKVDKEILVIGNGFDLRAGIKSSFNDFIIYVVCGCILHNYKKYSLFKDDYKCFKKSVDRCVKDLNNIKNDRFEQCFNVFKTLLDEDCDNLYAKCHEFAENNFGKLLLKHIFPKMYQYLVIHDFDIDYSDNESVLQHRAFDNDCLAVYGFEFSYEEYLSEYYQISYQQFEIFKKGVQTVLFLFLDDMKNNYKVLLWSDVESVIEMIVTNSKYLREKYEFNETIKKDFLSINGYLHGLNLFEVLLSIYLKKIQSGSIKDVKDFFEDIKNNYSKSLNKRSCKAISFINLMDKPDVVINYNYTNIAKRYYCDYVDKNIDIKHINGSLEVNDYNKVDEIKTNIVIGYSNTKKKCATKDFYLFEKQARRLVKNTEYINISKLIDKKCFNLVIMGHSCGVVDSDVLKPLLSDDYLQTAVVLCHSIDDLAMIYTNLKKILDEEKFCELLTYDSNKLNHNLYFSVECS